MLKMVANADDDTMSTSFSGIEAPHTAACANRLALAKHLGIPPDQVPLPKLLHMIEWDSENQEELLLVARQTGACLFSDPRLSKQIVFDFWLVRRHGYCRGWLQIHRLLDSLDYVLLCLLSGFLPATCHMSCWHAEDIASFFRQELQETIDNLKDPRVVGCRDRSVDYDLVLD